MAAIPPLSPAELASVPPRLRKAAQDFEAQALARLMQPALDTVAPGRFGGGTAEAQRRPMLADAFAASAVRAGQGLGLSDAILRELLRRQGATPSSTEDTPR